MELIPPNTKIDFVSYRNWAMGGTFLLIVLGIAIGLMRGGPNLGIDFSGGSLVHVRFHEATTTEGVRKALDATDIEGETIQSVQGAQSEFLIRLPLTSGDVDSITRSVTDSLTKAFGDGKFEVLRIESVGPLVGQELRKRAFLAISFATLMMGVYIWIRFEWRFGFGAAVALLHDVLLTIAALMVWNYEFDLTIVAALLTIVGFSVNDTVIVSDRVRENMRKNKRQPLAAVINASINETLSRTFITTGTAILVVIALYVLGGPVIHGFAFALLVGFIVGTYSSIYIATPIVLFFEGRSGARTPTMVSKRA
jgi:preprotein translocase subunit SecF